MRNRAKCNLCKSEIESFHLYDYVSCKCGEIAVSGGIQKFEVYAKNYENFLRIDEKGNEIPIKVVEKDKVQEPAQQPVLSKKEKMEMLDKMIQNIESLPNQSMTLPVTHYDLYSFMLIVSEILKSD